MNPSSAAITAVTSRPQRLKKQSLNNQRSQHNAPPSGPQTPNKKPTTKTPARNRRHSRENQWNQSYLLLALEHRGRSAPPHARIVAGALGSLVHGLRSVYWYVASESGLELDRKYLMLPFTGSVLAVLFLLRLVRGGFFSPEAGFAETSPFALLP